MAANHTHSFRIVSISLEGPIKVLYNCQCSKTEVVVPSKRIRKVPTYVKASFWDKLLETLEDPAALEEVRLGMIRWLQKQYS